MKVKWALIFMILLWFIGITYASSAPPARDHLRGSKQSAEARELHQKFQILKTAIQKLTTTNGRLKALSTGADQEKRIAGLLARLLKLQSDAKKAVVDIADKREMEKQLQSLLQQLHNTRVNRPGIPSRDGFQLKKVNAASPAAKLRETRQANRQEHDAALQKIKTAKSAAPMSLSGAGNFSGFVTDESSNDPLPYAEVDIYDSSGEWTDYAYADESGAYTTPSLAPGTYYARTYANSGYLNELFDNIPCDSYCNPLNGTPIGVTAGAVTLGIDFILTPFGSITGSVTSAKDGTAMADVEVDIFDTNGDGPYGYGYTDASGNYSATGLRSGNYYAKTYSRYPDELYNDVTCDPTCKLLLGTQISVSLGSVSSGVDFALSPGGAISGTVTDSDTGLPLADADIEIYDAGGWAGYGYTDNTGSYLIDGLKPGSYFVLVWAYDHVSELYDNIACPQYCDPVSGTPVTVAFEETTGGINFALDQTGNITGRVTDTKGTPIPSASIHVYDSTGHTVSWAHTDESGYYDASGLMGGTYFVRTFTENYVDQLYNTISCDPDCDVLTGTPIPVSPGQTANGVDFTLGPGGMISGKVVSKNGTALESIEVDIFNSSGDFAAYGYTDQAGSYSVRGLTTGVYFARTYNYYGYMDELYDNIPCSAGCDPTKGTPISVVEGSTVKGVGFALDSGGAVKGRVVDEHGDPIEYVEVDIYNSVGEFQSYGYTDQTGAYTAGGLPGGVYFARTYGSGYLDELYDNLLCVPSCDPLTGTPISVKVNSATTANFKLSDGGHIMGIVTSATTGAPLEDALIEIRDSNGDSVSYGYTGPSGSYDASGLLTGNYFALTRNYQGYVDELYQGILCEPDCNASEGTPVGVTVDADTRGVNFALQEGGRIAGNVSSADGPLSDSYVDVYNSTGDWISYGYTDFAGDFVATGLPTGNYFARAGNYDYVGELYNNIQCEPDCDVTAGAPISVITGQTTTGIQFVLEKGGTVTGEVTDAGASQPIPYIIVRLYNSSGEYLGGAWTNQFGLYRINALPSGQVYARTDNWNGYANEIYDNIPCYGDCNPLAGAPITVTSNTVTGSINFALSIGAKIQGTIRDASNGNSIYGDVDIYDESGNTVAYGYSDESGTYTVEGLQTGNYFAVAYNYGDYVPELYNGAPCFFNCDPTGGTPIAVAVGLTTAGIDFSLEPAGHIQGTVTDSTTGAAIRNVEVYAYDSNANLVASGYVWRGNFQISGLPAGNYYLRSENSGVYVDELYDNIPCPGGSCDPKTGTPVAVTGGNTTSGINFSLDPPESGEDYIFGDDFEDGIPGAAWSYSGSWSESGGNLIGSTTKKATAIASPAFIGCDKCAVETTMSTAGGTGNSLSLIGWYKDKANMVELIMKEGSDKWMLQQHAGGSVVAKASFDQGITPNITVGVRIRFDGAQFRVYINNVLVIAMNKGKGTAPFGTVGLRVKSTVGAFGEIDVTAP